MGRRIGRTTGKNVGVTPTAPTQIADCTSRRGHRNHLFAVGAVEDLPEEVMATYQRTSSPTFTPWAQKKSSRNGIVGCSGPRRPDGLT